MTGCASLQMSKAQAKNLTADVQISSKEHRRIQASILTITRAGGSGTWKEDRPRQSTTACAAIAFTNRPLPAHVGGPCAQLCSALLSSAHAIILSRAVPTRRVPRCLTSRLSQGSLRIFTDQYCPVSCTLARESSRNTTVQVAWHFSIVLAEVSIIFSSTLLLFFTQGTSFLLLSTGHTNVHWR